MITFYTSKGSYTVETWDEVKSKDAFLSDLNPGEHELKDILSNYTSDEKVGCGLSSCHTPHNYGYMVLTKDGYETNIGQICGSKFFGVQFKTLSKKFDRDVTEFENRTILKEFSPENINKQIVKIRKQDKGADWIHRNCLFLIQKNKCPEIIVSNLYKIIKSRNRVLVVLRQATEQEIDALEATSNRPISRPHYIEQPIAEISGIEALYPENDLRQLLITDLENKLREFVSKDIDKMTFNELRTWAKWVGTINTLLKAAERIVSLGRTLLTKENLFPLTKLVNGTKRDSFSSFLDSLSK
jgi:hypothetical protein